MALKTKTVLYNKKLKYHTLYRTKLKCISKFLTFLITLPQHFKILKISCLSPALSKGDTTFHETYSYPDMSK